MGQLCHGGNGIEMNGPAEKAFMYRLRAEELKAMIPDMKDRVYAKILENIADDYYRLADMQEQIAEARLSN
jgi:hypothetical protein